MSSLLEMDRQRYSDERMPLFHSFFRLAQKGGIYTIIFKPLFIIQRKKRCIDLSIEAKIGGGATLVMPRVSPLIPTQLLVKM